MTRLYTGSIIIDGQKMDEVIRELIIKKRETFKSFLIFMGKDNSPLPNATYYAWRNRNRIRASYIKKMEDFGVEVDLFIK